MEEGNYYEDFIINNHNLKIKCDKSKSYAGKIWDCAYVFSSFISSDLIKNKFKNKTVAVINLWRPGESNP